jgi:hypothetical protein
METIAVRAPYVVGVKVTLRVQLLPTATEFPQVWLSEKSPGLDPPRVALEMLSAALPVF